MVTIKDIAREAGVSATLVSFVMNNRLKGRKVYRVSEETENRVLEVARRLGYQPNIMARALRSGESRVIGVIISDIANRFYAEIARGIADWAYQNDYMALFGNTDESAEKLSETINLFDAKGVRNFLIVPCEGSEKAIETLAQTQAPMVLIDRDFPNLGISSVTLDNVKAARLLTSGLIDKGCRNIEMVSYRTSLSNIRDREQGYLRALEEHGCLHSRIHHPEYGNFDQMQEIVREAERNGVDGLVFATYRMALLGRKVMYSCGGAFHDFCRVACFNNYEELQVFDRDIIFARQPIERFSSESISLLLARIEDRGCPPGKVLLEPEIIDTSSSETFTH